MPHADTVVAAPAVRATVLVVDDHALLRTGVANIINQESDLQVVAEASNGLEAVEAFERHHPDVTLLDLRMPVMEGVEAVRQIRERDPHATFRPTRSSRASTMCSPGRPTSRRPRRRSWRKASRACSSRRASWPRCA
jgi:CheY-like chemotaxis protein